jgi:NTP pyrophosphatase (non-canonical NTP hydrolase)
MTDVPDNRGSPFHQEFDRYQQEATRTLNRSLSTSERMLDAAAGLAEEAGEVLALVRKHLFQQRPLDREQLLAELGDALWCLSAIATVTEISLGDVARHNLAKLYDRYPEGFAPHGHRPAD